MLPIFAAEFWTLHHIAKGIQVLSPLATTAIAGAVGLIAYRQWRVAKDKLKLDLYNKRWAVYASAIAYYHQAIRNKPGTDITAIADAFVITTRESVFLFRREDKITELLRTFDTSCRLDFRIENPLAQGHSSHGILDAMRDRRDDQPKSTEEILAELEEALKRYLAFYEI